MTKIEWTERSWNPTRGCTKVSPGCKNCYAEQFATRFEGVAGHPYELGFSPRTVPSKLDEPLRVRKPTMWFVNSMSDLFHPAFAFEYIAVVWGVMAACQRHTFQVLTKHPKRAAEFFAWVPRDYAGPRKVPEWAAHIEPLVVDAPETDWPLPNVWLGVSVEDRKRTDRIDVLRHLPAAVRFLSCEPLLEDLGWLDLAGIGWVIVGGESGPKARPCFVEWIRNIVAQCREPHLPVFVKQLGSRPHEAPREPSGIARELNVHGKGGDVSQWPPELRVREWPRRAA